MAKAPRRGASETARRNKSDVIKKGKKGRVAKKAKGATEITKNTAVENKAVDYDDGGEEEEDGGLPDEMDEDIPSGDEGGPGDERRHQKLLEAISALGGKKKRKLAERSEATVQMSEFSVNAEGEGDKIDLSDLIETAGKTPGVSAKTKSQIKSLQFSRKTLDSPLSRQETERIQRDLAYQKTAEEVSRWKSIVKQNSKAEQLVFPLNQEPSGPKPLEQVVCGWKAQTPLEQEIFRLLSVNKQPVNDPVLTPMEEDSLKAMSLEEAKIRRAELQKARVLQSYYEAKAKRERSIKSKKYHKVHNKAKRKDFVKQFDEMVKTDPTAALEELSKMETARMQERMSLKHQNSGKWAKSKAIMAKYDQGARKAMQQQLEVNRDLTQKKSATLNDDEEGAEEVSDAEALPDFVNDAEPGLDPANPWMRGKLSIEPAEAGAGDTAELTAEMPGSATVQEENEEEEEEEGTEETEEEALLRGFAARRKMRNESEKDPLVHALNRDEEATEESKAEEEEEEEEEEEGAELAKFTSLYQGLADGQREARAKDAMESGETDPSAELEQALFRVRNLEDVELLGQDEPPDEHATDATDPPPSAPPETHRTARTGKRKRGIDLNKVLTKGAKVIAVPFAPTTVEDAEEKDEQRGIIKEAFAGDDVVSDFLRDKRSEEQAGKPKEVNLTLPGWGEWGGLGLKPSRRKRSKFRVRAAPPPPRRDRALPSVIISQKRNSGVSVHQLSSLPFPFKKLEQFEGTIRTPIGSTWNTQQTVKKLTLPKVVTKLGAIIEPMSREDLKKHEKQMRANGNKSESKSGSQGGKMPRKRDFRNPQKT